MERLVEQRRQVVAQRRREWAKKANSHAADEEGGTEKAHGDGELFSLMGHADVRFLEAEVALPEEPKW